MSRFMFLLTLVLSITGTAVLGGNAEAAKKHCLIYRGSGGEVIFPGWESGGLKLIVLEVGKPVSVWLNDGCRKPAVQVKQGKGGKLQSSVERESMSDATDVAKGWRIFLWTTAVGDGKPARVNIKSGESMFTVEVKVHENVLGLARKGSSDASDAKRKADEAKHKANNAEISAEEAERLANESYTNAGDVGGKRDVELVLSPMFSLESPGKEGYGLGLGINSILSKHGPQGQLQLGVAGRLSWHYYEQEVIGLAQNADVMASEFDAAAMGLLRYRPINWFAVDASLGVGVRVFTHDDSITIQDQDLLIRGVEGNVAWHPIGVANLGVKFYPHRSVSIGVNWGLTVSMTRQVQNPNAEGGEPGKANVKNHFLMFNFGFTL